MGQKKGPAADDSLQRKNRPPRRLLLHRCWSRCQKLHQDLPRLQKLDSVRDAVNLAVSNLTRGKLSKKTSIPRLMPASRVIEDVRKNLKINKKQFLQCWEVFIYLGLDPVDKYMEDFVSIVSNLMNEDIIGKESGTGGKQVIEVPSEYIPEMSFVMFKSNAAEIASTLQVDENRPNQEEHSSS